VLKRITDQIQLCNGCPFDPFRILAPAATCRRTSSPTLISRNWLRRTINGSSIEPVFRERHIAAEGEFTSDLATQAARQALDAAGVAVDDIDICCWFATTTPDLVFPSTACIVQSKLGMTNGKPAFDLQAVCSGFVYALSVADQFIKTVRPNMCW